MLKSPYKTIVQDNGTIKIYGNCHKIPIIYGYELTAKQKKDFDYYSEEEIDDQTFFKYRGNVYDFGEFTSTHNTMWGNCPDWMKDFDGYTNDSFFSGILIRYFREDNREELINTDFIQAFLFLS